MVRGTGSAELLSSRRAAAAAAHQLTQARCTAAYVCSSRISSSVVSCCVTASIRWLICCAPRRSLLASFAQRGWKYRTCWQRGLCGSCDPYNIVAWRLHCCLMHAVQAVARSLLIAPPVLLCCRGCLG